MASNVSYQDEKKGGKRKTGIIVAVVVIVIIALLAVIGFLVFSREPQNNERISEQNSERRSTVITEDNVEEVFEEMANAQTENGIPEYYTVTMNYDWTFENGEAESSNAYVENNTQNSTPVYFDVFLSDDQENPIYQSPVLPVGQSLDKIKLDKVLDAGTYDCLCIYHLVDEEQNTLTTVTVTLNIVIEG